VNFGNHPETALRFDWFSADYPRYLRERLAMEYGGGAIYLSGALGGLITPLDVSVPARDENGDPITEGGEVVWWTEFSWERTRAYGYVLAETVIDLLDAREPTPVTEIRVRSREYLLPITNIVLYLAHMARIIEPFQEVHEPGCGPFGCIAEKASVIAFGDVQITTSPGETFPETILGRQEVTIDYGDPWGEKTYEAIDGVLDYYTQPVAMHFGLTNNFLGYIVPENDYLPVNHPEHYCEIFSAGKTGERLLRETLIEILDRDD